MVIGDKDPMLADPAFALTHHRHLSNVASFLHDAKASPQSGFSSEKPPGPKGSSTCRKQKEGELFKVVHHEPNVMIKKTNQNM